MRNIIRKIIKETIAVPHMHQPTGNSCGPTCLRMVSDYFRGEVYEIADICHACGTDWVVGTPPERMAKGLAYLGIQYTEHINDTNPFQVLRDIIDQGHPCIIRTVTKGIPHWIVAVHHEKNGFGINDPWLGRIFYTEKQLDTIWRVRDYFFYEVTGGRIREEVVDNQKEEVILSHFENEAEMVTAVKVAVKAFPQQEPEFLVPYLIKGSDWDLSVKATYKGEIVGFYFLAEASMSELLRYLIYKDFNCSAEYVNKIRPNTVLIDLNEFDQLEGVEGVALGVDPKYQGLGVGKKLIEYSQRLPYDYIWGQQLESLANLDHWTKRREIAAKLPGMFYTYQML